MKSTKEKKLNDMEKNEIIHTEMTQILHSLNNLEDMIKNEYGLGSKEKKKFNEIKNRIIYNDLNLFLKDIKK